MARTLLEALESHVESRGDKIFTRHTTADGSTELTFRQFSDRAHQFAAFYSQAGLEPGRVALIFLPTSSDALPAFIGAMLVGAIPSFMPCPSAKQHPSIYWPSHQALLERIDAQVLVTDRPHAGQMRENALDKGEWLILATEDVGNARFERQCSITPDEIALLQHSSGTTSLKKGVALSHAALLAQAESYARRLEADSEANIVSWLPLYHDMGLIACAIIPLALGQTVTLLDPFHWAARPAMLLEALERFDGAFTWLPNFAFEHLVRATPRSFSSDLSRVRAFINCSESCKPETFERFVERFGEHGARADQLQVCYAMAETVFAVTQTTLGEPVRSLMVDRDAMQRERVAQEAAGDGALRVLSTGRPIEGIDVQIRVGGTPVNDGRIGEIVASGTFLFDGYFNDPATTDERLVEGLYQTRDLGFMADGELYVLGRKDDLIIVNGRNLHAHEVETIVADVRGLKPGRAVAFGIFNVAIASEELIIVAERDSTGIDDDAVGRAVRDLIYGQTNIDVKDIRVVEPGWLIKTTSGKISREKNREKYLAEVPGPDAGARSGETGGADNFGEIAAIIAGLFRFPIDRITGDTVASDVSGWDSLAHATLVLKIEESLGIAFADDEIFSFECVGDLVRRANELARAGRPSSSRVVFENKLASIVRMGERSDAPDIIVFAGAAEGFAGQNMLDFASTLGLTSGSDHRKFFVTDKRKLWFTRSMAKLAAKLNRLSGRPKILIGNSMGGYAALKIAPRLDQVIGVLSFVPQSVPPWRARPNVPADPHGWRVMPQPAVPYCIIFGEFEDEAHKQWIAEHFADEALHTVCTFPSSGHNVVRQLNRAGRLVNVLDAALSPPTMGKAIGDIIANVDRKTSLSGAHQARGRGQASRKDRETRQLVE